MNAYRAQKRNSLPESERLAAVRVERLVMPPGWKMLGRGDWLGPHDASVTYEYRKWWLWQTGPAAEGPFESKEQAAHEAA
jgi:hypothetical protein